MRYSAIDFGLGSLTFSGYSGPFSAPGCWHSYGNSSNQLRSVTPICSVFLPSRQPSSGQDGIDYMKRGRELETPPSALSRSFWDNGDAAIQFQKRSILR